MLILHVNWSDEAMRLWAESMSAWSAGARTARGTHPFSASADELERALRDGQMIESRSLGPATTLRLRLPADEDGIRPSERLAAEAGELESGTTGTLPTVEVPALTLRSECAIAEILRLEDRGPSDAVAFGHSLTWWIALARFVLELLADQRFIPTLLEHARGNGSAAGTETRAAWRPWLHDESARSRMAALLASMPPVVRAGEPEEDAVESVSWTVLRKAVDSLIDASVREALTEADFIEAVAGRDPVEDQQVAWLGGLLDRADVVAAPGVPLLRDVRGWLSRLEDAERVRPFRLGFRLTAPEEGGDEAWPLTFYVVLEGEPAVRIGAERVWAASPTAQLIDGHRIEQPQELLLAELGRASRIYPEIEPALSDEHPRGISLTTEQAAQFLREHREVLEESGFDVSVPEWWGERASRLGVRLQIDAADGGPGAASGQGPGAAGGSPRMGLDSLVRFHWQLAVGDQPLTEEQLRRIAESKSPLIRVAGRWVENTGEQLRRAAELARQGGGETSLREAIRLVQRADASTAGLPVLGMDAHGWVADVLGGGRDQRPERLPSLAQPTTFLGELRPYQQTGLSWLAFLERFGFGACLADDMGLGKTIQLIALLLHERAAGEPVGPTLLVVPTSLIENWARELKRFAPSLTSLAHHGPQRLGGEAFHETARQRDLVITTYALVPRDRDTLTTMPWWRVVLDEAQFIKNPPTQQAGAIRQLQAPRRVALTGTPVENRLSELWSIMEFCNPGYLGPAEEFRRRCAVPIERHRDRDRADSLRRLVQPFILRRLKTDADVISDLPDCVQTKEYASLTPEQAALYQRVVEELMASVDELTGMQRRGRVLAALTRLKQVCNHPAHMLAAVKEDGETRAAEGRAVASRSGKCQRLMVLLEELLAAGDQALIFTQYRRMGDLLAAMIRHELDAEAQFMHGGTPPARRHEMVDRFQRRDGSVPVFILSLRTGGVGLNLTAANHVFHFDRWWNPAVENQATDRAFRIGQTRTVHVHKFVCTGTLEERIDEMIEQKTELADNVISAGESWLTELSSRELHEVLQLRAEAMEVDA